MEIAPLLSATKPLVISIAAGIRTAALAHWLGPEIPIVRAMPNTPALFGSGATALFAMTLVNADQREMAESILRAVGLTVWVEEEAAMDAVTALSGSGPAYYFLLMELMENAAANMDMPRETARLLTLQTAFGAAKMALESGLDAATLRKQVTSPGGTTEQALRVFESRRLGRIVEEALGAAKLRSEELAKTFGE
jgi:pyrroline-5-carboxylate reductase